MFYCQFFLIIRSYNKSIKNKLNYFITALTRLDIDVPKLCNNSAEIPLSLVSIIMLSKSILFFGSFQVPASLQRSRGSQLVLGRDYNPTIPIGQYRFLIILPATDKE